MIRNDLTHVGIAYYFCELVDVAAWNIRNMAMCLPF